MFSCTPSATWTDAPLSHGFISGSRGWDDTTDLHSFPLTLIVSFTLTDADPPHFLSIAYGVIAGILSYLVINGIPWLIMKISRDRIVPPSYEAAEEWSIPPGSIFPRWILVLTGRAPMNEDLQMEDRNVQGRRSPLDHLLLK
ncbi:hypothetical protein MPER_13357, partial [Moniliophthora perniciosa FA553]